MAKMTLEMLVEQLKAALDGDLRAVALYGSAATAEQSAKRPDYNILVIVDSLSPARLSAVSATMSAWADTGQSAPLLLTTQEWLGSADIFAMEYADILGRNRVLHGALPEGVRVDPTHLRLELEHEAMGTLLQLRRGYLAAGPDGKLHVELLEGAASSLMALFRAIIRLRGETPPVDAQQACASVCGPAGADPAPFVRVARHRRGEEKIRASDAAQVAGGCLDGLQRVVRYLDQFKAK